jgi:nucleoside-diphosphate-sugar epimerase
MYGERDRQFIPRVARLLSFGLAPIVGSGESIMPIVHAGNVADAFVRAASSEAAGGRVYNVANDFDLSYLRFLELAEAGMQARIRRVRIRASLAHGFSGVIELALRAGLGRKVPMPTRGTLDFVTRDNPFSSARARAELGWLPLFRPEEMVPASFAWWRQSRTKPR